jgi:CubicO group peptidase (beta-lactamase class C family)
MIAAVVGDDAVTCDDETPAPWWSFTKTVLAAAALRMVAAGRIPLDTPLRGRAFTLRQVLQHRAGLGDYGSLPAYHAAVAAGDPPWPVAELLHRVGAEQLRFEPGEGWAYSNIGYLLVRTLIEEIADEPLAPALRRLVFDPLGVTGVTLACAPADLDATAWRNPDRYHPGWVYHGLLLGSATSAALVLHHLLAGRLLPQALTAAMRQPYPVEGSVPGRPWRSAGYGLGLMIGSGEPAGRYEGHTGMGPGSTAAVFQRTRPDAARPPRTAAVMAAGHAAGVVERRAMALAAGT